MLKVGDRVYYISGKHNTGVSNPLVGSEWECCGTIRSAEGIHVSVLWDNKTTNAYIDTDLARVSGIHLGDTNPNMAFLQKKIRRKPWKPKS